jgi:hypothetical protein
VDGWIILKSILYKQTGGDGPESCDPEEGRVFVRMVMKLQVSQYGEKFFG